VVHAIEVERACTTTQSINQFEVERACTTTQSINQSIPNTFSCQSDLDTHLSRIYTQSRKVEEEEEEEEEERTTRI
jgi:putative ubiquitin-RnfH superfamily antitoxin RatB of RatAB toxin-antitoxin module